MKRIKRLFSALALTFTMLVTTANAGNFLEIHFNATQDVTGFQVYKSDRLATNLHARFDFAQNQDYIHEFDDRSVAQDSYIILRINNQNNETICDVEITPASFNRHVQQIQITNYYNNSGLNCELTPSRRAKFINIK